jgi:hypothetical protein
MALPIAPLGYLSSINLPTHISTRPEAPKWWEQVLMAAGTGAAQSAGSQLASNAFAHDYAPEGQQAGFFTKLVKGPTVNEKVHMQDVGIKADDSRQNKIDALARDRLEKQLATDERLHKEKIGADDMRQRRSIAMQADDRNAELFTKGADRLHKSAQDMTEWERGAPARKAEMDRAAAQTKLFEKQAELYGRDPMVEFMKEQKAKKDGQVSTQQPAPASDGTSKPVGTDQVAAYRAAKAQAQAGWQAPAGSQTGAQQAVSGMSPEEYMLNEYLVNNRPQLSDPSEIGLARAPLPSVAQPQGPQTAAQRAALMRALQAQMEPFNPPPPELNPADQATADFMRQYY